MATLRGMSIGCVFRLTQSSSRLSQNGHMIKSWRSTVVSESSPFTSRALTYSQPLRYISNGRGGFAGTSKRVFRQPREVAERAISRRFSPTESVETSQERDCSRESDASSYPAESRPEAGSRDRTQFNDAYSGKTPDQRKYMQHLQPPPPKDFSRLFSESSDVEGLKNRLRSSLELDLKNVENLIHSFESIVFGTKVRPINSSLFHLGKEMIELRIYEALIRTYPHLMYSSLVELVQQTIGKDNISSLILSHSLEPYISLLPTVDLRQFSDPAIVCLDLATNTYFSLVGAVFLEKGFEEASQFVFSTLKLRKLNHAKLQQLESPRRLVNKKASLTHLLYRLRLPLPTYKIERAVDKPPIYFHAAAMSGDRCIGRGVSKSKAAAEQRAAGNALFNYWLKEKNNLADPATEEGKSSVEKSNESN